MSTALVTRRYAADQLRKVGKVGRVTGRREGELWVSEAAEILGVSASTVRAYERRKPPLLKPARRLPGSRYRVYDRDQVVELRRRIDSGEVE